MTAFQLLGHETAKQEFLKLVKQQRLPHALLLNGEQGIGKWPLLKWMLAHEHCQVGDLEQGPCGLCRDCRLVESEQSADVMVLEPEKNNISIDSLRQAITFLQRTPLEQSHRTLLIRDAVCMSEEAQNALLKTCEEPPAASRIFLATHHGDRLLPTLQSRCQNIQVPALPSHLCQRILEEQSVVVAAPLLVLADGSPGLAMRYQDLEGMATLEVLLDFLVRPVSALHHARRLLGDLESGDRKKDWEHDRLDLVIKALILLARDAVCLSERSPQLPEEWVKACADHFSFDDLMCFPEHVDRVMRELPWGGAPLDLLSDCLATLSSKIRVPHGDIL